MIPEIGHFALILAMWVAVTQAVLPLWGAARNQPALMRYGHRAALVHAVLILAAFGLLAGAFWANDFSVGYVAAHSNSGLPVQYRLAAVWGGHEGSMLLWVTMLALWTLAMSLFSRQLPAVLVARAIGVMGIIAACFEAFILFTSNPFARLIPAAADGRDLNPLLQDPGMVMHPPMLYMGYVGFAVAFALAIAALIGGRMDAAWARWCRPWTIAAWASLTAGIALGSWWAYTELGWGGWWFWDPVENASFLPWLTGTALLHSLAVSEKRGLFKSWTALLAITTFSMSLLGTFLVRSGVLTSVHAFATDPKRGVFILALLVLVIGGSFVLFAWRAATFAAPGGVSRTSREAFLLLNNALLSVAAGTVLLGTLYPLALDALGQGKISVGPPYFEAVFAPIALALSALVGVGAWARWGGDMDRATLKRLLPLLAVSVLCGVVFFLASGARSWLGALALAVAIWLVVTALMHVLRRLSVPAGAGTCWTELLRQPAGYTGMHLAHVGVAVFIVGVAMVKVGEDSRDMRMEVGQSVAFAGYEFRLKALEDIEGPNYQAARGVVEVSDGKSTVTLLPEKRVYRVQKMPMTEAAIDAGLLRDLYVSMGEPVSQTAWVLRLQVKPFINWIWAGCLLMTLGGLFAMSDRRYRLASARTAPVPASAQPAAAE